MIDDLKRLIEANSDFAVMNAKELSSEQLTFLRSQRTVLRYWLNNIKDLTKEKAPAVTEA